MPVQAFTPHPLLAPAIRGLYATERAFVAPNDSFDILPDSMIALVWNFGAPCAIEVAGKPERLPDCYAVGLLDAPLRLRAAGLVRTLRVQFYAWGFYPLVGQLLHAPPERAVRGLLQAEAIQQQLAPGMAAALAQSNDQAIELLQRYLIDRLLAITLADPLYVAAAQAIIARKGDLAIDELARATSISPRALRRMFHTQLGVGPKLLARMARFEHVRDRLWEQPDASLAELALDAGYADQAHMQRDFRQLSGRTPRQFAAEMRATRTLFTA